MEAAIVYVHGISQHEVGYSDPWYEALSPHLTRALPKHEVRWSDIVNAEAMAYGASEIDVEAQAVAESQLKDEIEAELQRRKATNRQSVEAAVPAAPQAAYGAGLSSLDDFVRYMLWESTRESVLSRFDEIVVPLIQSGQKLHILAHSWGTVVSYEGLRRLDNSGLAGRVANLIVLGSALSLGPVQSNLLGRVESGAKPRLVDRLINLDAGGDVVGGGIDPPFEVDSQHLGMVPTGCSTFWLGRLRGRHTARNPVCAHSSYFNPDNLAVNRDIIAAAINASLA